MHLVCSSTIQQGPTQWQFLPADPVGEEAVLAKALEALGQSVEQKPAHEFHRVQGHGAMRVSLCVVLPAKRHFPVVHRDQSLIRDGDTMGVAR